MPCECPKVRRLVCSHQPSIRKQLQHGISTPGRAEIRKGSHRGGPQGTMWVSETSEPHKLKQGVQTGYIGLPHFGIVSFPKRSFLLMWSFPKHRGANPGVSTLLARPCSKFFGLATRTLKVRETKGFWQAFGLFLEVREIILHNMLSCSRYCYASFTSHIVAGVALFDVGLCGLGFVAQLGTFHKRVGVQCPVFQDMRETHEASERC